MSLSTYAKRFALEYALSIWATADPRAYIGEGSEIRHVILIPLALIHAGVHQEIESLRSQYLGAADQLSEDVMDRLATNIPGSPRDVGTQSIVTMRMFLSAAVAMRLNVFPYFRDTSGNQYSPQAPTVFQLADARLSSSGELYLDVPCFSTQLGVSADAGSISLFSGLPAEVTRVTNPSAVNPGRDRADNATYLEALREERSDGSMVQVGGTTRSLRSTYPQIAEVSVVGAGDADMHRDEVFSLDGVRPNFERLGTPFAEHLALGTLDFDGSYGRAVATIDVFTSNMVGRRVAVAGDAELYRTIRVVLDARTVILSGSPLDGQASALLWGEGPHVGGKTDIYAYFPALHVFSTVVDRRYFLQLSRDAASLQYKVYVGAAPGRSYTSLAESGVVTFGEGGQFSYQIEATLGSDGLGTFLQLETPTPSELPQGTRISYWPSGPILIAADGDVSNTPVLFVDTVELLDPVTLEPVSTIPETQAGPYASPGWHLVTPDAVDVFSVRERKFLSLDTKLSYSSYAPIFFTGCSLTGSTQVSGKLDTISRGGEDFRGTEGRELVVQVPVRTINQSNIASIAVTSISADRKRLTLAGAAVQVFTELGWRTEVSVLITPAAALFAAYTITQCRMVGDTLERLDGGIFIGSPSDYGAASVTFFGVLTKPAYTIETVIAVGRLGEMEVLVDGGFKAIWNGTAVTTPGVSIYTLDTSERIDAAPVRVTYYSHPDFARIQTFLDDGEVRLNARDQMVRSYLPARLDLQMEYRGQASPAELQRRLTELLQVAQTSRPQDEDLKIDVSNILEALNQEGLADSFQTNFEVRVTHWLPDGEKVVRYLNPSPQTSQQMTVAVAASPGDTRIRLKQVRPGVTPPGRGRLILGGFNPDAAEALPYEAVIDMGDGTYMFLLRGTSDLAYAHPQWDGAVVGVRDWDPEMTFEGQEIVIPATCRPYLGQAVLIRRG